MKNLKKVFAVLFCCSLILMVSACSGSSGSDPYADAGKYIFQSMSMDGESLTADDMTAFGLSPSDLYIELKNDGTGTLALFDESGEITWKAGKITMDGEEVPYTVKDGVLTLEEDGAKLEFKLES